MQTYAKPFLSDFARRQWASSAARKLWEPRISRIGAQFAALERASVEAGLRAATLQNVGPEMLSELSRRAASKGLTVVVLGTQGRPESYSASPAKLKAGAAWDYRIALTRIEHAAEFVAAWGSDDYRIGELLGYPACCRRAFLETWVAGSFDPTWYMADHGDGPREANILLRWLGVRAVPHMPCSFKCDRSVEFGRKLLELMDPTERLWLEALLDMPMLWSAVNSIGEVITPIVSLNFRTDPAVEVREIRRNGSAFPEAGAQGVRFPYRLPPARRAPAELELLEHDAQAIEPEDPRGWLDNGFGSHKAMLRAHRTVWKVRPEASPRTVLDLGCGNGRLARALAGVAGTAAGVEVDPGRAQRAEQNLERVLTADMFAADLETIFDNGLGGVSPDLVLLMPGRIIEKGLKAGSAKTLQPLYTFIEELRGLGAELLVYAYGDWLKRYDGDLEKLCRAAGLEGELEDTKTDEGAAAGVWRFSC